MKADKTLDCQGLFCPQPVFNTSRAIKEIELGNILEVLATDPASVPDLKAWASRTGHELLESTKEGRVFKFYIKRTK